MPVGVVQDLSSDGWGVVKDADSKATFVPGTWPGDEIEYTLVSQGKFRIGKVDRWIRHSDSHRESPCPHWGLGENQCLACPWINIHYKDQLKAKELKLEKTLKLFGLEASNKLPIIFAQEFAYRNRIKLSVAENGIGFKRPLSNTVSPIQNCLVCEDWINEEMSRLASVKNSPSKELWIQKEAQGEFAQGNTAMNRKMKDFLKDELSPLSFESTIELFSGDGNFSEVILNHTQQLFAFEGSHSAIKRLNVKFPNAKAKVLNLYSEKSICALSKEDKTDLIVLDPPRSGFKDLQLLVSKLPHLKKIIYISCNPMTWGRDVKELKDWRLSKLQPFDLFPQTPHLEIISVFDRIGLESP